MPSRRTLTLLAVAVVAALGLYLIFGSSHERRVLTVIRELAAAVSTQPGDTEASRARRVSAALRDRTTESVVLSVPELGDLEGRAELEELLVNAAGVPLTLSVDASTVQIDPSERRARATVTLTATLRYPGEERRDTRAANFELSRVGDAWRVSNVRIEAKSRVEPEARP
jgi:hypothetical protein